MAPPFLAVTLDAKRRIARAAKSLSLDVGPFGWGYLELLEHVWERKDPRVSALVLSACFGPDERVPAALVEFGFVAVVSDGAWELAKEEADRLLLTHKQRVAAGKARSEAAGRSAGGMFQRATSGPPAADQRATSGEPALTPSTQHPAPSTQEKTTPGVPPGLRPIDVCDLWQSVCVTAGLPKWLGMSKARDTAAKARIREHPDRGWWETVLLRVVKSRFLRGENDRGWRANPDWLLRPGAAESVLEGKYDGGSAQTGQRRPTGAATAADTDWSGYAGPEVSGT